jgi:formylglycine-generating enzyme required for sulfatase activity
MKTRLHNLLTGLTVLAWLYQATAQESRFFRISGPAATSITAFNTDGTMVWSNTQQAGNYIIQTVASLPGGTNWVCYVQVPGVAGLNTNVVVSFNPPAGMTLIPAESFTMGDALDKETDAVPVGVTVSAFFMDVNLVSYGQWQSVHDWAINHGYGFSHAGAGEAANHPVQTVDWFDCVKWSNARSQMEGLTPAYYSDAGLTKWFTNGEQAVYVNWTNHGYRLPTEAEWEKAARGGLIGQRFPWGNLISESQANYEGNTNGFSYDLGPSGYNTTYAGGQYPPYTSPVGSFAANGYGLYDMAGNAYEWCWDWYGTPYTGGNDPHGPVNGGNRVLRGGSWAGYANHVRCAYRSAGLNQTNTGSAVGFRCLRGY